MIHGHVGRLGLLAAAAILSAYGQCAGGEAKPLWHIGRADNDTRDFALAPDGYRQYADDPVFVVGASDPKRDWPYVHPGPADAWAGSRPHTFIVAFGLAEAPRDGACRLVLDLVDTQSQFPPRLEVKVNGHESTHDLPRGAGDASVFGDPGKGREHRFTVPVQVGWLKAGLNEVAITTVAGSWVLYDSLAFEAPAGLALAAPTGTVVRSVRSDPVLVERDGRLQQTVQVAVLHMGPAADAEVRIGDGRAMTHRLTPGANTIEATTDAVEAPGPITVTVRAGGVTLARRQVQLKPVRRWVVYLLPHSHVDIGYTKVQTEVEQDHWRFYEQALEAVRKTAAYPAGARFKWNVEVLWAVDSYLRRAAPEKRDAFIKAAKAGAIGLDALYGNELTALCRPEELVRLTDFALRLRRQYGLDIPSAMITDVPGYTWGIVPVLAGSGVRYFSIGPNGGHRIGFTLSDWGNRAFWWVSPSGKERVLVWIPRTGYYRSFSGEAALMRYLADLDASAYPYDLVQMRYCLGDNAGPGCNLSDTVKQWNSRFAYPRLVIATTREMFEDFERRYGDRLAEVRGDFTPYWEDGAGSSARETALNRASAERLVQAEALWAMFRPAGYPDGAFYDAWRNVLLYDEHTWGAHNSIREPDSPFARAQWDIKQAFATQADAQSRRLLADALAQRPAATKASGSVAAVDVVNTAAWPRTDLVVLPADWTLAGDRVTDARGRPVPSQRLASGRLALLAHDVPPMGARRFLLAAGKPHAAGRASANGNRLVNSRLTVSLDAKTGAVAGLQAEGVAHDLVDSSAGFGANAYFYVDGRDPKAPKRNGPVRIGVGERGPLIASLMAEGAAPGCRGLVSEYRVVAGLGRVDIINTVDKTKVRRPESVHFGFPLNVPKGVVRMDVPFAVVRPEADQLRGACKNYFTVQRWVDVSGAKAGVTLATVDAPLLEVGRITVDARQVGWIRTLDPSTTLFSYVMNNYWETNYKADQEGPTVFRYSLRPHGGYDAGAAARFGIERSQPLLAVPADPLRSPPPSLLGLEPGPVIASAVKPSRDGRTWIVRLFNTSGQPAEARLRWGRPAPATVWRSGLDEAAGEPLDAPLHLAPFEFATVRALPAQSTEDAK